MAQLIPSTGKIVDTGVAQESPAHAVMESPAHALNAYPFIRSDNMSFTLEFGGLSIYMAAGGLGGATEPAEMINICSDTDYVGIVFCVFGGYPSVCYYNLGTDDDRGYAMTAPIDNPARLTFSGAANVWSNSLSAGTPYYKSSLLAGSWYDDFASYPSDEPDGNPFTAWCCANNVTANWTDQTWYDPGTWTFTVNINETGTAALTATNGLSGADQSSTTVAVGMQGSFTATLNFGDNTATGNITSGWSGTGVSGNTNIGSATIGQRIWQATVTLTFTSRWQFNATFGPIDFTQPTSLNPDIYGDNPVPTGTFYCAGGQVSISGSS